MDKTWTIFSLSCIGLVVFTSIVRETPVVGEVSSTIQHNVEEGQTKASLRTSGNSSNNYLSVASTTISADIHDFEYKPSFLEKYVMDHAIELGFDENPVGRASKAVSCSFITNSTDPEVKESLLSYRTSLEKYKKEVMEISSTTTGMSLPLPDIRKLLRTNDESSNENVCRSLGFAPDSLAKIFGWKKAQSSGNQDDHLLSYTPKNGYIEPLLPPLRHPDICHSFKPNLLNLNYLVHDFFTMCMNLKVHSRIVLVDMGASLMFHKGGAQSPAIYLMDLYTRFGFKFDHIYAYEMTQQDPLQVFNKVPEEFKAAYHWINVGVSSDPTSSLNPLRMILRDYDEDDLIIVKLDIDTPEIELPLAHQILNNTEQYGKLIDHFYFEHHVNLRELKGNWGHQVSGSVFDSLKLFQGIRKNGIAAHSWV